MTDAQLETAENETKAPAIVADEGVKESLLCGL